MSSSTQASQTTGNPLNEGTENSMDIILAPSPTATPPNVSDVVKIVVTSGLKLVPYVGTLLSGLVGLLWPTSGPSVWDQVRAEVEQMIDEKINDAIFNLLKAKLDGLGANLRLFLGLVASHASGETIRMQFIATNTLFVAAAPEYKNPAYQWTIGPLFSIFSQLHISLLRDCVLHGQAWNWPTPGDFQYYVNLTQPTVNDYIGHIDKVLNDRRAILQSNAPTSHGQHRTDIYNYWQTFNQQKVVAFDDYRQLLIYLNPITHPGPTARVPFADAYSRAYGTADNWDTTASGMSPSGGVTTPYGGPLTMISSIYQQWFNFGPRVINVQHGSNGPQVNGGNRVNQYGIIATPRTGVETKTVNFNPVAGRDFVIQKAFVRTGSIPLALTLILYNGREEWMWDKHVVPGGTRTTVEVAGRMLTTLNMWTASNFYDYNLGCIIFGFSRDSQYLPPQVRNLLYVTSIYEPGDNRTDSPKEELDKERTAYWDELKRLAKEKYPSTE